ncbi:molecular chaperone DnaJ [Acinetobacter lanii]|uniref:Molecular chaperone DnaJ n=1 Tax=Acinetobacter lanii TaxID=2715163 RepID=A0A6G8S5W3_9GAMM|nr:molecular chaperone DnaJ [Acinetobacter lanii]QIO09555.1 molecular chaperone DnaJ [Acinetobacter lanii]
MSNLDLSLYQTSEKLSAQQKKFNRLLEKIEQLETMLEEWQQAQKKVQQNANDELFPLYCQWHQVLFNQLETLWQYKNTHKIARTYLEHLDEKISILASQLLDNPNLSTEQHELVVNVAQSYELIEESSHIEGENVHNFDHLHQADDADGMMQNQVMKEILAEQFGVPVDWLDFDLDIDNLDDFMQKVKDKLDREEADFIKNQLNDKERDEYQKFAEKEKKKILKKQAQLEEAKKMAELSLKKIYLKIAALIHPDREQDEQKRIEKTELLQKANAALEEKDLLALLKLRIFTAQGDQEQATKIANEHLKSYNLLLEEKVEKLQFEIDDIVYSFDWIGSGFYKQRFKPVDLTKKYQRDLAEIREKLLNDEKRLNDYKDFDSLKILLKSKAFSWSFE